VATLTNAWDAIVVSPLLDIVDKLQMSKGGHRCILAAQPAYRCV